MTQPSLRGRVVLKFPANVVAGTGIVIDKTNSTYTFSIDPLVISDTGVPEAPLDGVQYGRQSGTWTPVVGGGGGDTTIPSGDIPNPLIINKTASGQDATVVGTLNGLRRWRVVLGDVSPESTGTQGSDFRVDSYNDDGTFRNIVLHADRETSEVTLTSGPAPHHAVLSLNKLADGQAAALQGKRQGSLRWGLSLGDGVTEGGGNTGANFRVNAYSDTGAFLSAPFFIERSTGKVLLTGGAFAGTPILAINKLVSGQTSSIQGQTAGVARWQLSLGDVLGESGTAGGSDFRVNRYNNAGTLIDAPLWVRRDTGTVTLTGTHAANEATLAINKTAGGMAAAIQGQTATSIRWQMALGDGTAESGSSGGSDFRLQRYNNSGVLLDVPVWIRRDNGVVTFTGSPPDQGPIVVINKTSGSGGQSAPFKAKTLTSTRWHLALGDGQAETGGNAGSNFRIQRHSDGGAFIDVAMYLERSSLLFAVYGAALKPGGGLWADTSDSRIKTVSADYTTGLDAIETLRPVKYIYKGNDTKRVGFPSDHAKVAAEGQEFIGLIAQEAEVAMPEMVTQTTAYVDGVQVTDLRVMDTAPLIYALINSCKELASRVEALEAQL